MKMSKERFIETLKLEAGKQGINLTSNVLDKMYNYKELLIEWNDKINLTTIVEDYDIIVKHIVDSLIVTKYIEKGQRIIDVGTGAGLPGLIIGIFFEGNVEITLLDSSNKKIIFLNDVIDKLKLKNIYTVHARAEELCHEKEYREEYNIALARAVAGINVLSELLSGYVSINGVCIFMKAGCIQEEIDVAQNALTKMQLLIEKKDNYEINYFKDKISRTIIVAKKVKTLEKDYPRIFGKIKKDPF